MSGSTLKGKIVSADEIGLIPSYLDGFDFQAARYEEGMVIDTNDHETGRRIKKLVNGHRFVGSDIRFYVHDISLDEARQLLGI